MRQIIPTKKSDVRLSHKIAISILFSILILSSFNQTQKPSEYEKLTPCECLNANFENQGDHQKNCDSFYSKLTAQEKIEWDSTAYACILKIKSRFDSLSIKQEPATGKKDLNSLVGVYHSYDATEFCMPFGCTKSGAKSVLKISRESSQGTIAYYEGPITFKYYVEFDYNDNNTGQTTLDSIHHYGVAEIIDYQFSPKFIRLKLAPLRCKVSNGRDETQFERTNMSGSFEMLIQVFDNHKVIINTKNSPKFANKAWNLVNREFQVLIWSLLK